MVGLFHYLRQSEGRNRALVGVEQNTGSVPGQMEKLPIELSDPDSPIVVAVPDLDVGQPIFLDPHGELPPVGAEAGVRSGVGARVPFDEPGFEIMGALPCETSIEAPPREEGKFVGRSLSACIDSNLGDTGV